MPRERRNRTASEASDATMQSPRMMPATVNTAVSSTFLTLLATPIGLGTLALPEATSGHRAAITVISSTATTSMTSTGRQRRDGSPAGKSSIVIAVDMTSSEYQNHNCTQAENMTKPVQDQPRASASCTTPSVTTPSAVMTPMPRNNHPIGVRGDLTATSQPTVANAVNAIINES